jgi:hypothetical protein
MVGIGGQDLLIEDVSVERFYANLWVETAQLLSQLVVHRSTLVDAYIPMGATVMSVGAYVSHTSGVTFEANVFDHDGWNETEGEPPLLTNHDLVIEGNCSDIVVRDNLFARAAAKGLEMRGPGSALGNLFVGNPIAASEAAGDVPTPLRMTENVVLHPSLLALGANGVDGVHGWGLSLVAGTAVPSTVDFSGNVVAHGDSPAAHAIDIAPPLAGVAQQGGDVVYQWGDDSGAGTFVDPSRSIMSFQAAHSGAQTLDAFLTVERAQRRGQWLPEFDVAAVRQWLADGFAPK